VEHASPAAVDPADLDLAVSQQAAFAGHLAGRSAPADCDDLRMLAQQQRDLPVVAVPNLFDQPPLKLQAPLVTDSMQQKSLYRRGLLFGLERAGGHGRP